VTFIPDKKRRRTGDITERTPEDKERMFARVDKLVSIEREAKAKRIADAEAWIAEVRARKNQQKKETA
jgi:hypothetical protein